MKLNSKRFVGQLLFFSILLDGAFAPAAESPPVPKPPAPATTLAPRPCVAPPSAAATASPKAAAPTAAPGSAAGAPAATAAPAPAAGGPTAAAALIMKKYDEPTSRAALASGKVVLLVFSANGDATWIKQAPVLQLTMREPEFAAIDSYQIDLFSQKDIALKLGVTQPGTLILFKKDAERVRSVGMVKPEALRKMLRLAPVL